jgi:glyoxylase-like metal-dependent hydrolase (beta-lactamase superfamily II)
LDASALAALGVHRIPIPIPFVEAGGPVNVYAIEEEGGGIALFDAGFGTAQGQAELEEGLAARGFSFRDVRRILVSHGHTDHFGNARAIQAAQLFGSGPVPKGSSDAPAPRIFVHPRDAEKLSGADQSPEQRARVLAHLAWLGCGDELLSDVRDFWDGTTDHAQSVERLEPFEEGMRLSFARMTATVLHLPGHTPGLCCLWEAEQGLLFSSDHLLENVSPNPFIDLEGRERPVHRALAEYLRSISRVRSLPVTTVLPGHGPPFGEHAALIDRLLGFYDKRQARLLELLREQGPSTPAALSPLLFPRAKRSQQFLVLCELFGNLEVLEDQGLAARRDEGRTLLFEAV